MQTTFLAAIALLACATLSLYDFYLDGVVKAQADQQARRVAYCNTPGHSETLCNGWGM